MKLGILGGGRAAWAYGSAWRRIGWPIDGVWLRPESKSALPELLDAPRKLIEALRADLLLIAVSDRAIDEVAARIPDTNALIFHASGAKPGVRGGFSLHPLKALPPVGEPSDLDDALLVFEGNHRRVAQSIASGIGARFGEVIKEEKPRYHAAAVFGSNYVAALLDIAQQHLVPSTREHVRDAISHGPSAKHRNRSDGINRHNALRVRRKFTVECARRKRKAL